MQSLSLSQSFEIKPSQQHEKLFDVLRVLAILSCVLSTLAITYKATLIMLILVLKLIAVSNRQSSIYQLRFTEFSGWEMAFANNDYRHMTILGGSVITTFVVFLHCRMHDQALRTFVIAKDSLSKNDFRRLVVRLTLSGHEHPQ